MKRIGPNLFQAPDGSKIVFANGEARHFPAIDRRPMALDDRARLNARDEREDEDDEAEDEALGEAIADAVTKAVRDFRAAKDARRGRDESLDRETERAGEAAERSAIDRAGNMTSQNDGRDALPNPKDHRQDFRSGDGRARDAALAMDRRALLGLD